MCKILIDILLKRNGNATILQSVTYPDVIDDYTPFDITYTVKNTGDAFDKIWGCLISDDLEVADSRWAKYLSPNKTITKTYSHPGLSKSTVIKIEVGYD
jgi:hypothetical protein